MRKWLPLIPIVVAVAFTAATYDQLPAVVTPDWNRLLPIDTPAESMGRLGFSLLLPLVAAALWAAFVLGARVRGGPGRLPAERLGAEAVQRFEPTYHVVVLGVTGLIALMHIALLASALAWPNAAFVAVGVTLGLGLIAVGNLMPRVRQNWIVGIRTRDALEDPEVWMRTHRYFGFLLMLAGVAVIVIAFVAVRYAFTAFLVGFLVAAILAHRRGARSATAGATIAATLGILGCLSPNAARALPELRIDGSPGVAPLVAAIADAYGQVNSGAPVRVGAGLGSSARIQALAENRIDLAMASHGVDSAALRARGIVAVEIARTAVVFAVHSGVDRRDITPSQACDIYAGRLARWSDDLPIVAHARPDDEVDAEVANAAVPCLRSARTASVIMVERPDAMAGALATTPGAFGVTSMAYVQQVGGRIRALALDGIEPTEANVVRGRYPMTRRAILLAHEPFTPAVHRFLEFVQSDAGARVLRANGAIPTR
jgi:phosphate transport system substrate-binding protein